MRLIFSFFFALKVLNNIVAGKHWALVVATSKGYDNYRHQADACHAYQILHKHGIPDENIVVMMYDDIANHTKNPTPGELINRPNGPNVYQGVPKDYTNKEVTSENFLNILQGNKDQVVGGSGKVIDSGPDDDIFVYLADHGGPSLVVFPKDLLYARELNKALMSMNEKKRYKKMVLYIEACESGSMFQKLPTDMNIFVTTAANATGLSFSCYYDEKRDTYLGDVYSVKWMEDSDNANFLKKTLESQFKTVRSKTNTSQVTQHGDMNVSKLPIGNFQGDGITAYDNTKHSPPVPITDAVPSPDVPLNIMHHRLKKARTSEERDQMLTMIKDEHEVRQVIKNTMLDVVERLERKREKHHRPIETPTFQDDYPTNLECYEDAVTKFREECFDIEKYNHALRHINTLVKLCNKGINPSDIQEAIKKSCHPLDKKYVI